MHRRASMIYSMIMEWGGTTLTLGGSENWMLMLPTTGAFTVRLDTFGYGIGTGPPGGSGAGGNLTLIDRPAVT
jgi:hypothetical protein